MLGRQFHQMSRDEFESQPGTYFHGHPTGNFNWQSNGPQGFHVGSHRAAEEAVTSRARYGKYSDGSKIPAPMKGTTTTVGGPLPIHIAVADPESIRGGRIESPMVNSRNNMGEYGKGYTGDMLGSGDAQANGRVMAINTRGQTMRQGIFYKNMAEDAGSVSAVVPTRQSWKTHEDYLVEARARGEKIPAEALQGYKEIPGQQRLF